MLRGGRGDGDGAAARGGGPVGYEAVLVTDMPPWRNPDYHEATDRPDTLDFDRLGRFAQGLAGAIGDLADTP